MAETPGAGPRRIHVLPDSVANQIAAGEVVERPASVVKELVENALDAGARSITVEIAQGGRRLVRVADDGFGMIREDLLLSLDRHATSKIRRARDLGSVRSFGFRGEALPSIAAVSRMTLESRARGEDVGTRVRVDCGRIVGIDDHPRAVGTTVEVRALFANAPARAKFLKASSAEARAVSQVVTQLAIAHPGVEIRLRSGDRELLDLPAATELGPRIARIWPDQAGALVPLSLERDGWRVFGLVQRPDAARAGVRRSFLFVNGRPFQDPGVVRAVDRGYRTTVPEGARPWCFVFLSAPDGDVDVNVHPAKLEVRFRDRTAVEESVEQAVRSALAAEDSAASMGPSPARVREVPPAFPREQREVPTEAANPDETASQMTFFVGAVEAGADEAGGLRALDGGEGVGAASATSGPRPRLFQVFDTFILAETRDGILVIDQHSAHERIMFESLMGAFETEASVGQRLLFPMTLRLLPAEFEAILPLRGIFARAGFELDAFGEDTLIVHSVPDPHPWFDAERCLRDMIAELTEGSELVDSARNQHERIAKTFACKGSVKAGQRLSPREMEELFDALFATELPHHDVHGRPTVVRLTRRELERRFAR